MRPLLLLSLLVLGCTATGSPVGEDPLYFAIELRREGESVAHPKLLGFSGKTIRAERHGAQAGQGDYRLELKPTPGADNAPFSVEVSVEMPGVKGQKRLLLAHGEERRVELGRRAGELQAVVLLMRVNSPEFRTLMRLRPESASGTI